jgi:L-ascorbate metabolism protein UlaG (beta-lactamase superfamily)
MPARLIPNILAMKPFFTLIDLPLLSCYAPATESLTTTTATATTAPMDSLQIHPVFHSSMVLQYEGTTIYVDPHTGGGRFANYPAPDLVLITDIHPDHLDTATLAALPLEHARIVAPKAVMDLLPARMQAICTVMANGDTTDLANANIVAMPMYNLPDPPTAFHPKGRGNGYVLTFGGKRIYISGDTQGIPEMRALKNIDVAFVCMNLPYTMDVEEAADAVLAFRPKVVYPYHYRGKDGLSDVQRFKELVNAKDPAIEVRLVDWYPAE